MYFTVDERTENAKPLEPARVDFIIENPGQERQTIALMDGGKWLNDVEGTFTTPVSDDWPVNNLFLILKCDEKGEAFFKSIADIAPDGQEKGMSLLIKPEGGDENIEVPIRSLNYGTHSLSFYRQSHHQTL